MIGENKNGQPMNEGNKMAQPIKGENKIGQPMTILHANVDCKTEDEGN